MIQLILSGCRGRMGRLIAELAKSDADVQIVAGFHHREGAALDFPVYANPMEYSGTADCLIDFSAPAALDDLLRFATSKKIPILLGTTGYSQEQIEKIQAASEQIPVFRSANMSIGVNVLMDLVRRAAAALEGYDIEIVERHHNQKLDAPSGTALMLADAAAESVPYDAVYTYDRSQRRQKRDGREIGISAIRGGTIVGEHAVIFAGYNEVIELRHSAQSRDLFAAGALRAAKYLSNVKEPGLYDMPRMLRDELSE